ncbi:MAG: hypothetical protein FJ272_23320, partial [Planctomycetes bacterium]|nr:hypothetical protein [Planctomycetota bacterium]
MSVAGQAASAPVESEVKDGVLKVTAAGCQVVCDARQQKVSLRFGELSVEGKGTLLKLSPGEGNKISVTDLAGAVKDSAEVKFGPQDQLAARMAPHEQADAIVIGLVNPGRERMAGGVPLGKLGLAEDAIFAGYDL